MSRYYSVLVITVVVINGLHCMCSGSRSGRLGTFVAWENCDCSYWRAVTKSVINKGWSRNACVNRLLRKMAWSCAKLNCELKAVQVAGAVSILPDTISRLHEKGKIHYLILLLSHWHHSTIPLSHLQDHISIKAFQFLVARCGQPERAVGPGSGSV